MRSGLRNKTNFPLDPWPSFSPSAIAETEHARSNVFDNPESVYKACTDMKLFNQEVLRVVLLNTRQRLITMIDVTKGSLNESLAYPRDIFRPAICHSAHAFIRVHNLWVATHKLCYVERGVMCSAPENYRCLKRFYGVSVTLLLHITTSPKLQRR
jgi:RadC-like JAB domain